MRHLPAIIVLLLVLILTCTVSVAQRTGNLISNAGEKEKIDVPNTGEWGWHKIHKKPVTEALAKSPNQKIKACPHCHEEKSAYKIFDPHKQLTINGDILKEKCVYCHKEKPDEKTATYDIKGLAIQFNKHLEALCLGCHSAQYKVAHPVNADHLLKPKPAMQQAMKKAEEQFDITLPLNYDGEIMCATCHNPHEKGVIPDEKVAAKGASEQFRVRLPGKADGVPAVSEAKASKVRTTGIVDKLCLTCHEDKKTLSFGLRE